MYSHLLRTAVGIKGPASRVHSQLCMHVPHPSSLVVGFSIVHIRPLPLPGCSHAFRSSSRVSMTWMGTEGPLGPVSIPSWGPRPHCRVIACSPPQIGPGESKPHGTFRTPSLGPRLTSVRPRRRSSSSRGRTLPSPLRIEGYASFAFEDLSLPLPPLEPTPVVLKHHVATFDRAREDRPSLSPPFVPKDIEERGARSRSTSSDVEGERRRYRSTARGLEGKGTRSRCQGRDIDGEGGKVSMGV